MATYTLRAVTVRHLQTRVATDTGLVLDGARLNQVKLVGTISWLPNQQLSLSDATGVVQLTSMDAPPIASVEERVVREACEELQPLSESEHACADGTYVSVVAAVDSAGGLSVVSMRPVTDFNEVTAHALECIHQHLVLGQQ